MLNNWAGQTEKPRSIVKVQGEVAVAEKMVLG